MQHLGPEVIERLRSTLPDETPEKVDPQRRPAAVLIPLFVADDRLRVVLTLRTEHLPSHAGQVSFPGGGRREGDGTLLRTALRESQEEIALEPGDVDVLGVLGDMPTAGAAYMIRPYVGRIPHPYAFVPDPDEVARVFSAPLGLFADATRLRTEWWERNGTRYPVYFFDDVEGLTVWGATARILVSLCDRILGRPTDPVSLA